MLDTLMSIVAPHHCCGCGFEGTLLCENCKYDIISEPYSACVACAKGLAGPKGICSSCTVPYKRAWCIAPRQDSVQKLIDAYKFMNAKAAYGPIADLLDAHIPLLPENCVLVPVPTIGSHIRQRGFDHTLLMARRFGRQRHLPVANHLRRRTNTMQRGARSRQRTEQAKRAFECRTTLDPYAIYLLIDDVITTGATVKYAAQALMDAGATKVWVAAISRQPLD